jgi:undecaprenyl diphosphate synthase
MSESVVPAVKHIAIIMDGNRRWARKNSLSLLKGHSKGADTLESIVSVVKQRQIPYLTVYAFSTENWQRQQSETQYLMKLLKKYLKNYIIKNRDKNTNIRIIGDYAAFTNDIVTMIDHIYENNVAEPDFTLIIALNYGAREEISRAIKDIISDKISADEVSPELIKGYLDTKCIPDPEIIIRTSGEQRLSNFLLWQASYSELIFLPVLWPDFDESNLDHALSIYNKRQRRFGK